MKKKSLLVSILILMITISSITFVGCTKKTGLLTEYDFLEYSRMEYRNTQKGGSMMSDYREIVKNIFYQDGKKINKNSGIAKFTKTNEISLSFYPNVKFLNELFDADLEEIANKQLEKNYFFPGLTISEFAKLFANELFDRYIPGLKLATIEGRAIAFQKLEEMIGLKVEGKEYFLGKEFQDFVDGLTKNKIKKLKFPSNLSFSLKLKLKSKKTVIKNYFKDGSDLNVIQRIATFNLKNAREDNFLVFDEYDLSKKDAKSNEIFDNIIGNRIEEEKREGARKEINSILYGRLEMFHLDLIGVRE